MEPIRFSIYKGMSGKYGAMQLNYLRPVYVCKKCREKNFDTWEHVEKKNCDGRLEAKAGAILVEMASATGNNVYDWDNKVAFALDATDLGSILQTFQKNAPLEILHDPNAQKSGQGMIMKKLFFNPGKEGGFILTASSKSKEAKETISHIVPLLPQEVQTLRILFEGILPNLLAWK